MASITTAPSALYLFLYRRGWLTFLLLGASFVLFGLASANLIRSVMASWEFLATYGVDAVRDGGLWQFGTLVVSGYLAVAFYVVFKFCEKVLVERLSNARDNWS